MEALIAYSSVFPQSPAALTDYLVGLLGHEDSLFSATLPATLLSYSPALRLPRSLKANFLPRGLLHAGLCMQPPNVPLLVSSSLLFPLLQALTTPPRLPTYSGLNDPHLDELYEEVKLPALEPLFSCASAFVKLCRSFFGAPQTGAPDDIESLGHKLVTALELAIAAAEPLQKCEALLLAAVECMASDSSSTATGTGPTAVGSLLSVSTGRIPRVMLASVLRRCPSAAVCLITLVCFFAVSAVAAPLPSSSSRLLGSRCKSAAAILDSLEALLRKQSPRCAEIAVRQVAFDLAVFGTQRAAVLELRGAPLSMVACDFGQPRITYENVVREPRLNTGVDSSEATLEELLSLDVCDIPLDGRDNDDDFFTFPASISKSPVINEPVGAAFHADFGSAEDALLGFLDLSNAGSEPDLASLNLFTSQMGPPPPETPLTLARTQLERLKVNLEA